MSRKMTVWGLVVALWPVLLLSQSPESGPISGQSAKHEATIVDSSAAERQPANGGFELGKIGVQPAGWAVRGSGYRITTSDEQPAAGRQCATIVSTSGSERSPFGNLLQKIDARPFRGRRVRFRGAVRTEVSGQGNQAQMWLRVDRRAQDGSRPRGAFDNMFNRPITSSEWNHYEIIADVDVDAEDITLGVFLRGEGAAWVDDVSLEIVGAEVPATARRFGEGRPGGMPLDELKPGLYEVVVAERLSMLEPKELEAIRDAGHDLTDVENPREVTILIPLPLAYRDQVPLNFELTVTPREAVQLLDIYEDQPGNHVLKLVVSDVPTWKAVDVGYTSTLLVGPTSFDAVPETAPLPETWPVEAMPWLAATWCADADHERIQALAGEILAETDDVLEIVRRVEGVTGGIFRSAKGQLENLTAVEALDKQGSCTSCANLVAAVLRALRRAGADPRRVSALVRPAPDALHRRGLRAGIRLVSDRGHDVPFPLAEHIRNSRINHPAAIRAAGESRRAKYGLRRRAVPLPDRNAGRYRHHRGQANARQSTATRPRGSQGPRFAGSARPVAASHRLGESGMEQLVGQQS